MKALTPAEAAVLGAMIDCAPGRFEPHDLPAVQSLEADDRVWIAAGVAMPTEAGQMAYRCYLLARGAA